MWTGRFKQDGLPFNNVMKEKNLVCGSIFLFPSLSFTLVKRKVFYFSQEKSVSQVNTLEVLKYQLPRKGDKLH